MELRQQPDRLAISLELPYPAETVWAKLTRRRHVARWWGDHVELDAAPGGRFVERWRDPATGRTVETAGAVTLFEPPERLELTWADDDWPVPTEVAFRLEEVTPAGTRLTLEHRGWDRFPHGRGRELLEQHAAGWARHMRALGAYLAESGAVSG